MFKYIFIIVLTLKQVISYEYNGFATTYGGNTDSGACGFRNSSFIPHGNMEVAINAEQWENALGCGRCALVKYKDYEPVKVVITDICPECKLGDLDMFTETWNNIIKENPGRKRIEWDFTDCDGFIDNTIKLRLYEKNEHWFNIHPEHFKCGIKNIEIVFDDKNWINMERDDSKMVGLYFNYKQLKYPYKFKITSIYDEEIITDNYYSMEDILDTKKQFNCNNVGTVKPSNISNTHC